MTQTNKPLTTSREERGRAIAEKSGQIQKVKDNQYKVRSQSGNGSYEIKIGKNGPENRRPNGLQVQFLPAASEWMGQQG